MVQWWECSPPTNVSWVRFPDSASYVGWVCWWFSSLLQEVFLRVLRFSPLLKNNIFPNFHVTRVRNKSSATHPHSKCLSVWRPLRVRENECFCAHSRRLFLLLPSLNYTTVWNSFHDHIVWPELAHWNMTIVQFSIKYIRNQTSETRSAGQNVLSNCFPERFLRSERWVESMGLQGGIHMEYCSESCWNQSGLRSRGLLMERQSWNTWAH